jgi:hypothetical protein
LLRSQVTVQITDSSSKAQGRNPPAEAEALDENSVLVICGEILTIGQHSVG